MLYAELSSSNLAGRRVVEQRGFPRGNSDVRRGGHCGAAVADDGVDTSCSIYRPQSFVL